MEANLHGCRPMIGTSLRDVAPQMVEILNLGKAFNAKGHVPQLTT